MNEIIEKIAAEYKVKVEDLEPYKATFPLQKIRETHPNPDAVIEQFFRSVAKKLVGSDTEEFYGFVLTTTQPRETMSRRIDQAIEAYRKDPDEALKMGIVGIGTVEDGQKYIEKLTPSGDITKNLVKKFPASARHLADEDIYIIPLDNVQTFPSGKQNFRYLNALPATSWFMAIGGIVYRDNTPKKFTMTLNSNTDDFPDIPLATPVRFRGTPRNETQDSLVITPRRNLTRFEPVEGEIDVDLVRQYRPLVSVSSLQQFHESGRRDIAVEGIVEDIFGGVPTEDRPDPWTTLNLSDLENNTVRCICHPRIPINFSEYSHVIVFGQTMFSPANERYNQPEDTYNIFVDGIYVVTNLMPDNAPDDLDEEDLGIGEDF